MIKIIADTTSCIPPDEAQRLEIGYVPQMIVFGEETYRDDTEMNARQFIQRLRTSQTLPKTAAPSPALYAPIYQEYSDQGHTILVITPASTVSGTYRSATVASQDFPHANIHVLDSGIIAGGLGSVVIQAQRWAQSGMEIETLITQVMQMVKRERVFFLVDTLEFLYKGGRIGAAKALFGSLLQVKPILSFRDGQVDVFDSQRTHRRALARLHDVILADCPHGADAHVCLMHGDVEEEAIQIAQELGGLLDIPAADIPIYDLTPAILVHAGPGVLGISYFLSSAPA